MVTTKQRLIVDAQKIKIKESMYTPTKKIIKPQKKKARHEGTKELQYSQRTMNEMTASA